MLFAYLQQLDPLKDKIFWSPVWSALLAGLPVLVLFWLLVPWRWLAGGDLRGHHGRAGLSSFHGRGPVPDRQYLAGRLWRPGNADHGAQRRGRPGRPDREHHGWPPVADPVVHYPVVDGQVHVLV